MSDCALAWMDVISTEFDRSMSYYQALFGWEIEHLPMYHCDDYYLVRSKGHVVSGAEAIDPARGLAPTWTLMVECGDARTVIDRAVSAGGKQTVELTPALDLGSLAMVLDPWGATIGIWQPEEYVPSAVPRVPGRLVGAVLDTPDPDAAARYYSAVFGWAHDPAASELDAGLELQAVVAERPGAAAWSPVLDGASLDAAVLAAGRLQDGASPVGDCTLVADPLGATFHVRGRPAQADTSSPLARAH